MVLMTYQLPDAIREIAMQGEFDEFDLNVFFSRKAMAMKHVSNMRMKSRSGSDLIRGGLLADHIGQSETRATEAALAIFGPTASQRTVTHLLVLAERGGLSRDAKPAGAKTEHLLSRLSCCRRGRREAGIGAAALPPVLEAMDDPLNSKSITLSCGKLTTGVTVRPWTGIFILRNTSTPETYFQAAFRVQSPWTVMNPDGDEPNREQIIKEECYVFDFAPDRALRQIADYSCRLNVDESNPEKKVEEFISFLPVLAYDGSSMKQIDAAGILDIAMSGTSATLLAARWESALLVNVDNATLQRLMNNEAAA